jgi:hypothetical protein
MVMPAGTLSLSDDFSFLSRACRPSRQEVDRYANFIAAAEGSDTESPDTRWHEAELQLWLWRAENRPQPTRKARRTKAR